MTVRAKMAFLIVGIFTSVVSACLGLETQHSNHLGWALLFTATIFCASSAISLGILFIHDTTRGKPRDRSLWLPTFGVLAMSLVTPLEYLYMSPTLARNDYLQDLGLILFAGGLSFYLLILGSPTAGNSQRHDPLPKYTHRHPLALRWACHPGFASLMLFALGLSIGYSSLIGLCMVFFLELPGLIFWMRSEDQKIREAASE
jgi:protein-S-isoprenylcysteine O-methyltransferase Ste14